MNRLNTKVIMLYNPKADFVEAACWLFALLLGVDAQLLPADEDEDPTRYSLVMSNIAMENHRKTIGKW